MALGAASEAGMQGASPFAGDLACAHVEIFWSRTRSGDARGRAPCRGLGVSPKKFSFLHVSPQAKRVKKGKKKSR